MSDYSVSTDGYLVPCLFPIVSQTTTLEEQISIVYAFLKSKGASNDEIQAALRYLSRNGAIKYSDEELIENVEYLESFKDVPCHDILLSLSDKDACCALCQVSKGQRGFYLNEHLEDEFDALAMLYTRYYAGDRSHIMELGEKELLHGAFTGSCITKCSNFRYVEPINYYLAYSLYLHAQDNIPITYGCIEDVCRGVASVLHSRKIPHVGSPDIDAIMSDSSVYAFLAPFLERVRFEKYSLDGVVKHFRSAGYMLSPEFIREHSAPPSAFDGAAEFMKEMAAATEPPKGEPSAKQTTDESVAPATESKTESASEGSGPSDVKAKPEPKPDAAPSDTNAPKEPENAPEIVIPSEAEAIAASMKDAISDESSSDEQINGQGSRKSTEEKKAERKQEADVPVHAEPPAEASGENDEGQYEDSVNSLAGAKSKQRAIGIKRVIAGRNIIPLSATGTPYSDGLCGPDGLVNPYVELSDEVFLPSQLSYFSVHALGFMLEAAETIAVEYAICGDKEGFLLYLHKDGIFVFISENDWDYFEVVLNEMHRSIPKKLTLLSAPLYDFVGRMGEHLCRGVVSLYDAYRYKNNIPVLDDVALEDALGKECSSITEAMRTYHYRWKLLEVDAGLMNDDACIAQVYGYSMYGYRFSGSRYAHLGHNEEGYVVSYADSPKLRTGYFFFHLQLMNGDASLELLSLCYRKVINELGNGRKHAERDITLVDYAPERGITFVLPYINYAWAHNMMYLWLVRAYKKYVGQTAKILETVSVEVK